MNVELRSNCNSIEAKTVFIMLLKAFLSSKVSESVELSRISSMMKIFRSVESRPHTSDSLFRLTFSKKRLKCNKKSSKRV